MHRILIALKMEFLTTIRNRTAVFFSLIFPMLLFLLFGYIFKEGTNVTGTAPNGDVSTALWLLPGIITISIATNGVFNSVPMVMLRENGVLRRIQATPMPVSQYLIARIANQLVMVTLQIILALLVGGIAFKAYPKASGWYLDVAFILAGAIVFITIGQFIAAVSSKLETANIISQIVNMALVFLSNIYLPFTILPDVVQQVGRVLPGFLMVDILRPAMIVGHLAQGTTINSPVADLIGLGVYFIVALIIAVRFFRWT